MNQQVFSKFSKNGVVGTAIFDLVFNHGKPAVIIEVIATEGEKNLGMILPINPELLKPAETDQFDFVYGGLVVFPRNPEN